MKDSPIHTNGVTLDENGSNEKENVEVSPKVNVFQFMMNNRHKSIGRNSPGREIDLNQSTDSALSKKELKARKSKLESWAEQKGASKRKREYEEVGNTINHKLEVREKRMKKLLKFDGCQSDDEVITRKKKRRRKNCAVIESDSENSSEEGNKRQEKRRDLKEKEPKLTPSSVKAWKFKIKLSMADNDSVENEKGDSEVENVVTQPENEIASSEGENTITQPENEIASSEVENTITQPENETDISEVEIIVTQPENEVGSIVTQSENSDENTAIQPENETNLDDSVILITPEQQQTDAGGRTLRSRRSRAKNYEDYFLSDEEEKESKREKKKVKVAPVFLNALPKPKIDPKVAEARRQFLLSGIPSSLRREMERQQCTEEADFDVFPTISHVHQKSPDNPFWELPKPNLTLLPTDFTSIETKNFTKELINLTPQPAQEKPTPTKLQNCKKIIRLIKSQNPEYPVYKIYNSFCKNKPVQIAEKPKRRGRPRKNPVKNTPLPTKPDENTLHALWTEKYKPKLSTDIIGNHNAVSSLKHWLKNWVDTSKLRKKRKNSESDFDSDSCDSSRTNGSTVILKGPTGSGKTAAVYAVCNELGLSVIEVNASSKRTGKRLVQELQEATQSHQVRKKGHALSSFVNVKEKVEAKKMCVLLIEDVDVVFEQDEGFISALAQIIGTSKRPIILTMTDEASGGILKIINECEVINFSSLSSILTIWLQIVCLVEGYYVKSHSIEELLNYYKGDIRRTLLQLQMYVNSGGQPTKSEILTNVDKVEFDDVKMEDDNSNFSDSKDDCSDVQIHDNCLQGGDIDDLGVIWWNLPPLLGLPNFANVRLDKSLKIEEKLIDKSLRMLSQCYENLAFADVFCGANQYHESLERRWRSKLKDSLCLEENLCVYENNEIGQNLITRTLDLYSNQGNSLNLAVPVVAERRWRSKQLSTDEKLQEVVAVSDVLNRKSLSLDYMPYLREIARGDRERASNNTKRGNRYYSHLKDLGVRCNEATYKIACDVFKVWD